MKALSLGGLVATENRRSIVTVAAWGSTIGSLYVQALVQRSYLTLVDYSLVFAVCCLAGAVISDVGHVIVGYIFAMALAAIVTLSVMLSIPSGVVSEFGVGLLQQFWIGVLFRSAFPIPFIVFLLASVLGSMVGERYF